MNNTTVSTTQFDQRIVYGRQAEQEFFQYCNEHGYYCWKTGHEWWLPSWIHKKMRFILEPEFLFFKHFPDFAVVKSNRQQMVQIKAAPNSRDYPTVTMEKLSYEAAMKLYKHEIPVLVIWFVQGGAFWGQWVEKLNPEEPNTDRQNTNGSHTPQFNIRKKELLPIEKLLP